MRERERGSIVIEAMIAALIIAAAAGVLFEVIGTRAAAAQGLALRRTALLVAQSRLAAAQFRASELPGTRSGSDGSLLWRLGASPFEADEASAAGTLALVTISVAAASAPDRPLARLRTLRLAR